MAGSPRGAPVLFLHNLFSREQTLNTCRVPLTAKFSLLPAMLLLGYPTILLQGGYWFERRRHVRKRNHRPHIFFFFLVIILLR